MDLPFSKYQGIGNDFIVVERRPNDGIELKPELVAAMCHRHRGIGADGVLETGVRGGRPFMKVTNADGSHSEMCGNGLRCVARFLVSRRLVSSASFEVDTDAGPHRCTMEGNLITVEMRVPSLAPADVPVAADAPVIDDAWDFGGDRVRITAVSMGNPHAVTFDAIDDVLRRKLGPRMEKDERFPSRVNVGFAKVVNPSQVDLRVWERGAGWTQACGTGACAAAVAAVETGRAERGTPITVNLPGGALVITVGEAGTPVRMSGPAVHVFEGVTRV
jgi:diaminopimelate epimerase